ncbi:MAG: PAS domain S-box protein [Negativicutes bacterium]|nr:PAS domain S-box protein [Negativicutes bacterium]
MSARYRLGKKINTKCAQAACSEKSLAAAPVQDRLPLFAAAISDLLWETDAEHRFVYLSPRCREILGREPAELTGTGFFNLLPAEKLPESLSLAAQAISARSMFYQEQTVRHAAGHLLTLEVRATPVFTDKGQFCGFRGISRDITFRKELERKLIGHKNELEALIAERTAYLSKLYQKLQQELAERQNALAALHESEEQLRTLINAMTDIVCFKDGEGRWISANQFTVNLFGLQNVPYHGLTDAEIAVFCPALREALASCTASDLLTWDAKHPVTFEENIRTADGELIFETVKIPLFYPNGFRKGLLIVGRDITARKQRERENSRQERINLVGEMAVNLGHEIRNPMTTVRGYLQLLQQKHECEKYRSWLDAMIAELDKANATITDFISLAKNKSLQLAAADLNALIAAVLAEPPYQNLPDGQRIETALAPLPNLLLDEREIRQLLRNLLANALAVTPPGTALSLSTRVHGEYAVLCVADNGPGIPDEVIEKLGSPFVTTKRDAAGLGLAVCYHIASRHNAHIDVVTGSGGTAISVRFPIPPDAQKTDRAATAQQAGRCGRDGF